MLEYSGSDFFCPLVGIGPFDVACGESDEVLDGLGCVVAEEVDADIALRRVEGGDRGVLAHPPIL